ncbi:MAG: FimV/HubP family polar landmark protein [Methylobacter sp.]|nr:FimV/HubP family polar landmark protein [Methylobacter sp.]
MKKSKVRFLTKTLAVVSLLAPASGHPLGIGEIKLHSALNQNLDAEIALTLSGESVSEIKVNLAPPEKFDEAGVSWTYFLSKIKFETITQSNGSAVIKLTSKEALKEPFLDFLLEVSWPKGNLYREFTVLVDPPSVYNQATIPVSTSAQNYVQPPAVSAQAHANGPSTEGQYGPTLENDTLWSVAERARGQNDISVEQMMLALYEANPHAFYKGNVHALMAGKMLNIPERSVALKLSRNQALAEFNQHTKAWKNHAAPVHSEAPKKKPVQSKIEGAVDNQLTLAAPTKAAVTDNAVVTSEQVSAEKKTSGVAIDRAIQSKVAELEKQLAMMQELIALKDQQLAALQNQSQATPAAQDQTAPGEVAAAKPADQASPAPQQTVAQPAAPAPAVQPAEPVPPTEAAKPVQAIEPVQPVKPTPPVPPAQPVVQPEPEAGSLLDPYYLGGGGAAILALLGWLWWRKRKVDEETNTESMFASSSMLEETAAENISVPVVEDNAAVQHDAGTVGESSFLSEFTPSDFDSFDTEQGEIDPISEADVYLAYGRYQQAEELIRQAISDQPNRDECKLKLLEVFYANENKAAFEAYANELVEAGKRNEVEFWEKAAEMGREICPDSPLFSSGNDLFAVSDNSPVENSDEGVVAIAVDAGFNKENINAGMASFGESAGDDFDKEAAEPEDDLRDVDVTSFEVEGGSFVDEQRNNEDIDFDLGSFSAKAEEADQGVIASSGSESKSSSGAQVESIDFDLSSFSMDTKESGEADQGVIASSSSESKSPGAQVESIDFSLSSFSMDTKESGKADQGGIASSSSESKSSGAQVESIDFDLGSFSAKAEEADQGGIASSSSESKSSGAQVESIDFDLGSFSAKAEEADQGGIASSSSESKSSGAQVESIDFDLDSFSAKAEEADQGGIASSSSESKSSGAQVESIDFDLGSFSTESDETDNDFTMSSALSDLPSETPVANKELEFESLDFDFGSNDVETKESDDLDFSELGKGDKNHQDADFSADRSLDFNDDLSSDFDFDFDFDLDFPSTTSGQGSSQHDAFGVSDLTDMDELETKLDLAKAYVDMGDADAAKDIAREVLEQGTAEQKKIAQALLDELG